MNRTGIEQVPSESVQNECSARVNCIRGQVLDMMEAALGANHPEVAACVNNLAVLLKTVGRHEEAQHLYERSIAIKERCMGPTHPQVCARMHPHSLCPPCLPYIWPSYTHKFSMTQQPNNQVCIV